MAVSENLQERIARMGRTSHLLTHGVDLDFWQNPAPAETIPELARLERPLVVFLGVIDRRMDLAFVQRLAADLDRGTVLLVGPEEGSDPMLYRIAAPGPAAVAALRAACRALPVRRAC